MHADNAALPLPDLHEGSVAITGASAGIGAALALALARPGITLHLTGRNLERLRSVGDACAARGARTIVRTLDVRNAAAQVTWLSGIGRLDLVIANAGIGAGSDDRRPERSSQVREVFATNLEGALNTALPALEIMQGQAPDGSGLRGRIATIASIAGFVPGPGAASYCAAKAALDRWTIATAPFAANMGVQMTSVCPGYVRTPMTAANRFPMPGLMEADRAAAIILRGIARGDRRLAFPWWVAGLAQIVGNLPPRLATWLLSRPPGKAGLSQK